MSEERDARRSPEAAATEHDDIEILEVVGVDLDAPPTSADEGDPDEIDIEFGDADAGDLVPRERLIRLHADFDNLRKRIERERDEHSRHATGELIARLLPVIDNLQRALQSADATGLEGPLVEGVSMVRRQLMEELAREGLREIEALGCAFDPRVHDAVAAHPADGVEPNTVIEELQRGYFFHERVLRPALVRVSVEAGSPDPPEES